MSGYYGYGQGTIFRISPDGTFTNLVDFSLMSITNGSAPIAGLCKAGDGCLYGTTSADGEYTGGTIFRITTNGNFTVLYNFGSNPDDGAEPIADLILGSDGNLYGTTQDTSECCNDSGTIFRITTNGVFTTLYRFSPTGPSAYYGGVGPFGGNADGIGPEAGLVQGRNGDFYGTTTFGGAYGYGTIFRLTVLPQLQSLVQTNGSINMAWSIMPGQTYQIQFTTNLLSTNWFSFGSAVTATNTVLSATDSTTNTQCFYRIMLLQ